MGEHKSGPQEAVEGVVEGIKGKAKEVGGALMNTQCLYSLGAALLLPVLNPGSSTVFAQGSLIPSGVPMTTMKTLHDKMTSATTPEERQKANQ